MGTILPQPSPRSRSPKIQACTFVTQNHSQGHSSLHREECHPFSSLSFRRVSRHVLPNRLIFKPNVRMNISFANKDVQLETLENVEIPTTNESWKYEQFQKPGGPSHSAMIGLERNRFSRLSMQTVGCYTLMIRFQLSKPTY